ncbi:MAG: FtsX-like permease family protein [Ilumatobacteraceae bacterium]
MLLLVVFVGFAAGAVMTAWEYSRRADTALDRRIAATAPADGTMFFCPPGVDPSVDIGPCSTPEVIARAYAAVTASPHVDAAAMVSTAYVRVTSDRSAEAYFSTTTTTVASWGTIGHYPLVAGREPHPDAVEVLLSERMADGLGVRTGDDVMIAVCTPPAGSEAMQCSPKSVTVSGVVRTENDLGPRQPVVPGANNVLPGVVFPSVAWRQTDHGDEGVEIDLRLAAYATYDEVHADVGKLLPGWTVEVTANQNVTGFAAIRKTTRLQARSLLLVTAILLIAALAFIAQALTRQALRQFGDLSALLSIGFDTRGLVASAAMCALPVAVGGAVIGTCAAVLATVKGPTGIAGRVDVASGWWVDGPVLLLGAGVSLVVVMIVASVASVAVVAKRRRGVTVRTSQLLVKLPAVPRFGLGLGGGASLRGAVVASAAAVGAAVAAATLVASVHRVVEQPARYGAPWDYAVPAFGSPDKLDAMVKATNTDTVTSAALLQSGGPVVMPSVPAFFAVSYRSIKGSLVPVIVAGRAPTADDEVAVAPKTLAAMHKHIGDTISAVRVLAQSDSPSSQASTIGPLTIVGVALVTNGEGDFGPGDGIVLTGATLTRLDPNTSPYLVTDTVRRVPPTTAIGGLMSLSGGFVTAPSPPPDVQGLMLVSDTPWVIAVIIAVLGAAAFAHSSLSDIRRHRRQFGVVRALGFTRAEVLLAVVWRALSIGLAACAFGVPAGVVVGHFVWGRIDHGVGLVSPALVPLLPVLLSAIAALGIAAALGLWPGRRAGHERVADALRAE